MKLLTADIYPNYIIEFMSDEWIRNNTIAFVSIVLVLIWSRYLSTKQNTYITYTMGVVLLLSSLLGPMRECFLGDWNIATDLPLHLCGISGILCGILPFLKNKQHVFDFVFYTGIIGGVMSMLTPQMNSYDGSLFAYIEYYIRHSIILIMPIYFLQNLNMKLTQKSILKTFVIMNILLLLIMPFNFYVGGNYMYLAEPPQVKNPLVIGSWPYYLIWFELFLVLLLVFLFSISKISFKSLRSSTSQ